MKNRKRSGSTVPSAMPRINGCSNWASQRSAAASRRSSVNLRTDDTLCPAEAKRSVLVERGWRLRCRHLGARESQWEAHERDLAGGPMLDLPDHPERRDLLGGED